MLGWSGTGSAAEAVAASDRFGYSADMQGDRFGSSGVFESKEEQTHAQHIAVEVAEPSEAVVRDTENLNDKGKHFENSSGLSQANYVECFGRECFRASFHTHTE